MRNNKLFNAAIQNQSHFRIFGKALHLDYRFIGFTFKYSTTFYRISGKSEKAINTNKCVEIDTAEKSLI